MSTEKRTKWSIATTANKGNQSIYLIDMYLTSFAGRLSDDEINQHKANVNELFEKRVGQQVNLTSQKAKTFGEKSAIINLRDSVINVRKVIKSKNPSREIAVAFGIGNSISKIVSSVTAAGNMVINAYNSFPEWSKEAGIIAVDITNIQSLINTLTEANSSQNESKFERKAKTMDKNTLQRVVEDEVTRISALGALIFSSTDPSVVTLFTDLIPSSSTKKTKNDNDSDIETKTS